MAKPVSGPLTDAKLETVFLWVRDFKAMRAFYHETLGLPIAYENPHFVELRSKGCSIALHSERETHARSDSWHMEFLVRDIDAAVSELSRRGVDVPPIRAESFGRIAAFRDPEGNEIGLEEPAKRGRGKVCSGPTRSVSHRMAIEDQIKAVEDEIQKTPYNKATQHHIGKLKAKLARLKDEQETRRLKSGGGGPSYAVKKSGNATVGLVGFPSVGKSTLLNQITDATSAVAAYDFTTLDVIPGLLEHRGAKIQVLDMPGLIRGASKGRGRGREVLSVARACDLILLMIDVFETHVDVLVDELRLAGIRLNDRPADVTLTRGRSGGLTINPTVRLTKLDEEMVADICREWGYLNGTVVVRQDITEDQLIDVLAAHPMSVRAFVVVNKIDLVSSDYVKQLQTKLPEWRLVPISAEKGVGLTRLKDEVYETLRFMRVFLKPQGKEADMADPLIVKAGSDVGMVGDAIHRDWRGRVRHANVWGRAAQLPGQTVGLDHGLQDSDVLTIVLKKG